jgi:hypothetical protein
MTTPSGTHAIDGHVIIVVVPLAGSAQAEARLSISEDILFAPRKK